MDKEELYRIVYENTETSWQTEKIIQAIEKFLEKNEKILDK